MNHKNKKQIYLSITIIFGVAAIASAVIVVDQLAIGQVTRGKEIPPSEIPIEVIDFSVQIPDYPDQHIPMKKGETKVIRLDIYAPSEKPFNGKIGAVDPDEIPAFHTSGEVRLPLGISTILDKNRIDLPAMAETGIAKRDTVLLTLRTTPDLKEGTYLLAVTLIEDPIADKGRLSYSILHVDVQG